jgi:hypothetical protein
MHNKIIVALIRTVLNLPLTVLARSCTPNRPVDLTSILSLILTSYYCLIDFMIEGHLLFSTTGMSPFFARKETSQCDCGLSLSLQIESIMNSFLEETKFHHNRCLQYLYVQIHRTKILTEGVPDAGPGLSGKGEGVTVLQ